MRHTIKYMSRLAALAVALIAVALLLPSAMKYAERRLNVVGAASANAQTAGFSVPGSSPDRPQRLKITIETLLPRSIGDRSVIESSVVAATDLIQECMPTVASQVNLLLVPSAEVQADYRTYELLVSKTSTISISVLPDYLKRETDWALATTRKNPEGEGKKFVLCLTREALDRAGELTDLGVKRSYYSAIVSHELLHILGFDESMDTAPGGLLTDAYEPLVNSPVSTLCEQLHRVDSLWARELSGNGGPRPPALAAQD